LQGGEKSIKGRRIPTFLMRKSIMRRVINYISKEEHRTREIGADLSQYLNEGDIVCLFGDLGAGKTSFVKGVASGLKINPSKVNSPSYVLMNIYEGAFSLFHFDLYRLEEMQEISTIGYDEFLYGNGISMIEWADRLGDQLPLDYISVTISHRKEGGRNIKISSQGQKYKDIIHLLIKHECLN